MSRMEVNFLPKALQDAIAAKAWYRRRSAAAAIEFELQLHDPIERIASNPGRFPPYLHGARRCGMRRFPYSVVFRELPGVIRIVAVAHGKRRTGYWKRRK
jgi:plasmid stabilization system protein ParE